MARSLTPAPAATARWVRPASPRSRSARSRKLGRSGSVGVPDIGAPPRAPLGRGALAGGPLRPARSYQPANRPGSRPVCPGVPDFGDNAAAPLNKLRPYPVCPHQPSPAARSKREAVTEPASRNRFSARRRDDGRCRPDAGPALQLACLPFGGRGPEFGGPVPPDRRQPVHSARLWTVRTPDAGEILGVGHFEQGPRASKQPEPRNPKRRPTTIRRTVPAPVPR